MAVLYGNIGDTFVQIGREATYNLNAGTTTVTAATGRANVIGCALKAAPSLLDEMNLSSAGDSPSLATLTTTTHSGTLTMKANYAGTCIQRLLASAYGKHTAETIATSYRSHTYTEASTLPSLSLQQRLVGIPSTTVTPGNSELGICYTGVIVQGFTFKIGAGIGKEGIGTFDFDLWSPNCNSNGSTGITLSPATGSPPASPGTIADDPVMWKHGLMSSATTFSDGTAVNYADVRMKSMEFKRTNNIDTTRYYIGAEMPDGARRSAAGEHTMTVTCEFQTLEAFNTFKTYGAATNVPKVLFRGGLAGGATYKEMEFGLGANARLIDFSVDTSGYGIPTCTMTWRGHYSASALVINSVSTLNLIGSGYVRVQNGVDVGTNYITS
jgi:hypothetical protein